MTDLAAVGGPSRIGRYELCAEIASGGMGRVYLARASGPAGFEKLVALKTVHPDLAAEGQFVDMFLDEARIAAKIDHRNVCQVFDFGQSEGRYFIAMEYLVGEPVQRVLRMLSRRGERDPEDDGIAARIIAEAAEGLHAAHELTDERGEPLHVVHRDVSPHNVFVTYDGGVRIVDFGVARAKGRLHQTEADSLKGKLSYMAPETMLRLDVDRRVDVWGLGVVLFELLTSRRLVRGENEVDIILTVTKTEAPRISELREDIDPELEEIVTRALSLDRDERFATAREMGQALERWIAKTGVPVGPAQVAEFMGRHFEAERTKAQDRVDAARQSRSGIKRTPTELPLDPTLTATGGPVSDELELDVVVSEPPERPSRPWLVPALAAIGGGLAVGAAALAVVMLSGDPPEEPSAALAAPTAALPEEAPEPEPEAPEPEVAPEPEATPEAEPEPAEEDPAPRAVARTGELTVSTPGGWADVYIDGRRRGRTPLRLTLPAGGVRVELRPYGLPAPSGMRSMRRRVTIGERPQRISVSL